MAGTLVVLGTVVVVDSPAAVVGLAGMVPVVGHTARYLQTVSASIITNSNADKCHKYKIMTMLIHKKRKL